MKILHLCLFFCATERYDKNLLHLKNNNKKYRRASGIAHWTGKPKYIHGIAIKTPQSSRPL